MADITTITDSYSTTHGGINYLELVGSKSMSLGAEYSRAERIFRIGWNDRQDFIAEICGSSNNVPPFSITSFAHKYSAQFPFLILDDVRITPSHGDDQPAENRNALGIGPGKDEITYDFADVICSYSIPKDDTITFEFSTESILIPNDKYQFTDSNNPVSDITMGLPVVDVIVAYRQSTLYRYESKLAADGCNFSLDNILEMQQKISSSEMKFKNYNYDITLTCAFNTLKFESFELQPTSFFGEPDMMFKLHFIYRPVSWFLFFREDKDGADRWQSIKSVTGNKDPYETEDLRDIIPYSNRSNGEIYPNYLHI